MAHLRSQSPAVLLVVEDDPGDQILIQESFAAGPHPKLIRLVRDGEEALEYLQRTNRYASPAEAPRPDLITLDLNMPRLGGKELLARLQADPVLRSIPTVALTTSCLEEDVALCYAMGVNSFVQKPTDFNDFQEVIQHLEHYWLQVSLFPPRRE
ncbi:MAG: response regulator [Acidobacteria bacterium]|nr:response regulator [Acidobacteriota bacterium]